MDTLLMVLELVFIVLGMIYLTARIYTYTTARTYNNLDKFFYYDVVTGIVACYIKTRQVITKNGTSTFQMDIYSVIDDVPYHTAVIGEEEAWDKLESISGLILDGRGRAKFKEYSNMIMKYAFYDSSIEPSVPLQKPMILDFSENLRLQPVSGANVTNLLKFADEEILEIVLINEGEMLNNEVIIAVQTNAAANFGVKLFSGWHNYNSDTFMLFLNGAEYVELETVF